MASNQGFRSLTVYQKSYQLALKIFDLSKNFPKSEKYSLTDQILRSSRSVCANIAEAYRKRIYPKNFVSKLSDAHAEMAETIVWLDFAKDHEYLGPEIHHQLHEQYEEVSKMLYARMKQPEKFLPRS